jgi:hypothetical protein
MPAHSMLYNMPCVVGFLIPINAIGQLHYMNFRLNLIELYILKSTNIWFGGSC